MDFNLKKLYKHMTQAKKFASIEGLSNIFKYFTVSSLTRSSEENSPKYYYPTLDLEAIAAKNIAVDLNSIIFLIANAEDEGNFVYTGIRELPEASSSKAAYDSATGGANFIHKYDTYIWAQGSLIAGSDGGVRSITTGTSDDWIAVTISDSDSDGDYTLQVTHKTLTTAIRNIATATDYPSNNLISVLTSIEIDKAGHVTAVGTLQFLDTMYKVTAGNGSDKITLTPGIITLTVTPPTEEGGTSTTTYAFQSTANTATNPIIEFTVDNVKHLQYNKIVEGVSTPQSVEVINTNDTSKASDSVIWTAAVVKQEIQNSIEAGASFKGVGSVSEILSYPNTTVTSVHKGDMYKINETSTNNKILPADRLSGYTTDTASAFNDIELKIGDVLIAADKIEYEEGSTTKPHWYYIPSGDEIDTWRPIKVNGTLLLGSAITTKPLNIQAETVASGKTPIISITGTTDDTSNGNSNITIKHEAAWEASLYDTTLEIEDGEGNTTLQTIKRSKPDTSKPNGVNDSYIESIELDDYGHIVGVTKSTVGEHSMDGVTITTNIESGYATTNTEEGTQNDTTTIIITPTTSTSITGKPSTSSTGTTISLKSDIGISLTNTNNQITLKGTTYSVSATDTPTGTEEGASKPNSVDINLTGSGATSYSGKVILGNTDNTIAVTSTNNSIKLDYTGISTSLDWVVYPANNS